jgi:hypothetical protein
VARGVEEGQLPALVVDLIGADVLRDPAGLGLDDGGLADRVEQGRLAVVDVAHDRDHRRPVREVLVGVLVGLGLELLLGRVLDVHLAADLVGDQLHLVVGERLRRRPELAEVHQDLDQLLHGDAERLREVLDGDAGGDGDRAGRRDDLAPLLRARILAGAPLAVALARTLAALVDDHAALAAAGHGPARAKRPVRPVWSLVSAVSHSSPPQCRAAPVQDRPARCASGFC